MKILLVQTSFLGDTILSTPVISGLKTCFPEADLWMMTMPESFHLVKRDPLLAGTLSYDKRKSASGFSGVLQTARRIQDMAFEKVYALHRSPRTALLLWLSRIPERVGFADAKLPFLYTRTHTRDLTRHDVLRNLSILADDIPLAALKTDMRLFAPAREEIHPDLQKQLPPEKTYAVLVPGSVWNTKRWAAAGYRNVIRYFNSRGIPVVLSGSPAEKPLADEIANGLAVVNIAGKASIDDALYSAANAKIIVCNDSMALHMASAFKVPNVAIFCATSPKFGFSPWKNRALVVERKDLACKPCRRHGSNTCPNNTWACIDGLSPETVIQAVEKLL